MKEIGRVSFTAVYNPFTGEKPDYMGFSSLFISKLNVNESIRKNSEQREKPAERRKINEEHIITMRKNGTTYKVVLKAADGAKMAFEEMVKTKIEEEAIGITQQKSGEG